MSDWQNPTTITTWITVTIALMVLLVTAIVWLTKLYLKRVIRAQQKLAETALNHQKALLENSILVQERERNRIAADLHDDLLSKLSILTLASHGNETLSNYHELIHQLSQTTRAISHNLSPPLIEETFLVQLLKSQVKPLESHLSIDFWAQDNDQAQIESHVKLQILRIFQEVINNIVKHAQAKFIHINLRITNHFLTLSVTDNGIGFDPKSPSTGLGLSNIELRTQLLNGRYRFKPLQKAGMQFILLVPLNFKPFL